MIKDHVACSNCNFVGHVDVGAEECPQCKTKGNLAWVNPEEPEQEVFWSIETDKVEAKKVLP